MQIIQDLRRGQDMVFEDASCFSANPSHNSDSTEQHASCTRTANQGSALSTNTYQGHGQAVATTAFTPKCRP